MGQRVAVVTDSTADLPADRRDVLGIHVVPLLVHIDHITYQDGSELSPEAFYRELKTAHDLPATSQPSAGRFQATYAALEAEDVISIHISSKLSGTVNGARAAAAELPNKRVRVLDSGMVSLALGYMVQAAAEAAQAGASGSEIVELVDEMKSRARFYALLDTLSHAHRSGRIGFAQALLGSMLQVKPILTIREGSVEPVDRPRTITKGAARLAELALRDAPFDHLAVPHANNEGLATDLASRLAPAAPGPIDVVCTGAVIGTHCGPGAVAVCCIKQRR